MVFLVIDFLQKMNKWIWLYYYDTPTCFCSFFGGNQRPQKTILKLTDLYQSLAKCHLPYLLISLLGLDALCNKKIMKGRTRRFWLLLSEADFEYDTSLGDISAPKVVLLQCSVSTIFAMRSWRFWAQELENVWLFRHCKKSQTLHTS